MHVDSDTRSWSETMFGGCELGDKRRTRRLVTKAASLASHVGSSRYATCRGDEAASEEAYRLLRNDAVEPEAIAEGAFDATARAASSYAELLAVEDSTTLGYGHAKGGSLGDLGGPSGSVRRGFQVHSVLLLDARGERTLGLVAQQRWCRDSAERGQNQRFGERAYEDRERFKWQRASQSSRARRMHTPGNFERIAVVLAVDEPSAAR